MKKILKIIALFFAVVLLSGVVIRLSASTNAIPQQSESAQTEGRYRITYRAVMQDVLTLESYTAKIDELFFKEDGKYPTYYLSGIGAKVDELNEFVYVNDTTDYEFHGWYLDKDLTKEFDGEIESGTQENITLYASIVIVYWTKAY